jgi:DNA polymerase-3 subunit alpha
MANDFIHLHNHSEFSLLDGANRVKDLVALAVQHEMPAIALTDHGVMHGAVEFSTQCRKAGIKPIIGCEVYTSGRRPATGRDPRLDSRNYHLLLMAQNETGYRNLIQLVSLAHTDGFYYKPRVDRELLARYSEGLICSSACLGGEVPKAVLEGRMDDAMEAAAAYRDIFTPGRFFLELQNHGQKEDKPVIEGLTQIAKELNLPLIATNDIHYGTKEDAVPHDVLLCIGTNKRVSQPDTERMVYSPQEYYFKSEDEMRRLFPDHPDALHNTVLISEMVDFELKTGGMILPHYDVPEGHTHETWLEELCREGAKRRYGDLNEEQRRRIEYELKIINTKGYAAYFLIVADFVRYARQQGIPARCRGSAAGSVVSYLLGITNVDPLRYGLLFERFLFMERITPPDIDLDFADYGREQVIQYCRDKYGDEHVAQVITFGTLGSKAAVRDVCRALEIPLAEANRLAAQIPAHQGRAYSIDKCLADVPELKARYDTEPDVRKVLDTARSIEGLSRHSSVHAAAIVITPGPVTDYCPVIKPGNARVTQYDMNAISDIGLLKMDFLGLRTLTVVDKCVRMMKAGYPDQVPADFDIDDIPTDDASTFQLLQSGNCLGVFQLESSGMRALVQQIRPDRLDDIIPLVALYRPGPLGNGDTDRFIRRRHGLEKVKYLHPSLEPILKDTYGILVYQEQILKIAMQIAGMGPLDADDLRGAMSKKKKDKLSALRPVFVEGAEKTSGIKAKVANEIFDAMESFGEYGFNQNHSGAYAVLTYQTAWLKANYPTEFMAALLTSIADSKDKIAEYVDECRRMVPPIPVLPPDVNRSVLEFSVDEVEEGRKSIRFGLLAVKGVGEEPVKEIIRAREEGGPFKSIYDFYERVDVSVCQRSAVEAIVKAGGFDPIHPNRGQVIAALDEAVSLSQRKLQERRTGQVSLFGGLSEVAGPQPTLPRAADFDRREKLAFEKELLGLYITDHPLWQYDRQIARLRQKHADVFTTSTGLTEKKAKDEVVVAGIVTAIRRHVSEKSREEMAFVTIQDLTGTVDLVVFPGSWRSFRALLEVDRVVVVSGTVSVRERTAGRDQEESLEYSVLVGDVLSLNDDVDLPSSVASNGSNGIQPKASQVTLDLSQLHPSRFDALKLILRHYSGDAELVVTRGGLRIQSDTRINPTPEFMVEIVKLLGEDAVTVK